jgi:hypothetical protein
MGYGLKIPYKYPPRQICVEFYGPFYGLLLWDAALPKCPQKLFFILSFNFDL